MPENLSSAPISEAPVVETARETVAAPGASEALAMTGEIALNARLSEIASQLDADQMKRVTEALATVTNVEQKSILLQKVEADIDMVLMDPTYLESIIATVGDKNLAEQVDTRAEQEAATTERKVTIAEQEAATTERKVSVNKESIEERTQALKELGEKQARITEEFGSTEKLLAGNPARYNALKSEATAFIASQPQLAAAGDTTTLVESYILLNLTDADYSSLSLPEGKSIAELQSQIKGLQEPAGKLSIPCYSPDFAGALKSERNPVLAAERDQASLTLGVPKGQESQTVVQITYTDDGRRVITRPGEDVSIVLNETGKDPETRVSSEGISLGAQISFDDGYTSRAQLDRITGDISRASETLSRSQKQLESFAQRLGVAPWESPIDTLRTAYARVQSDRSSDLSQLQNVASELGIEPLPTASSDTETKDNVLKALETIGKKMISEGQEVSRLIEEKARIEGDLSSRQERNSDSIRSWVMLARTNLTYLTRDLDIDAFGQSGFDAITKGITKHWQALGFSRMPNLSGRELASNERARIAEVIEQLLGQKEGSLFDTSKAAPTIRDGQSEYVRGLLATDNRLKNSEYIRATLESIAGGKADGATMGMTSKGA